MEGRSFVNYYEVLGVAANVGAEAIERRFRELARRFHPDNAATGDRTRFDALLEAHDTLKDRSRRAHYHEAHPDQLPPLNEPSEANGAGGQDTADYFDDSEIGKDLSIQSHILALLYHRRRHSIAEPGIGNAELEQQTGCPHEHLEFHLWYLREKGWIKRGEDGLLAITIEGVDRAAASYRENAKKLITDQS